MGGRLEGGFGRWLVLAAGYMKKTPVIEWKSKLFPRCRGLFLSAVMC